MIRLEELRQDLISRGYLPKIIHDALQRVIKIPREVALQKVNKKENNRESFVSTYHPCIPSLSKIVRKHHSVMIESDPQMERCFPQPSLICYRRHKNIKDHLIRAKVSTKRHPKRCRKGFKPCGALCTMCALCPAANKHKSNYTGKEYNITAPIDCNTKSVVYKLTCKKARCRDFVYVGQTERRCKDRFYDHKSYIHKKRSETAAGHHFNLPGHDVTDMAMLPIERVRPANNPLVRQVRESLWIRRYDSCNQGANKKR